MNTHYVDWLLSRVNRVVVRKGMIWLLVTAGKMGVGDKTPIQIADVERMR